MILALILKYEKSDASGKLWKRALLWNDKLVMPFGIKIKLHLLFLPEFPIIGTYLRHIPTYVHKDPSSFKSDLK